MKKQMYQLLNGVRNRHVFMFDLLMFCCIPTAALLLRLDSLHEANKYIISIWIYTGASLLWKFAAFYPLGLYNRYWRYASVDELGTVVTANLLSVMLGSIVFFAVLRPLAIIPLDFPRFIPLLDGLLTTLITGGFRFTLRVGVDYYEDNGEVASKRKKALIVGAGVAGSMILKELKMNPQLPIEPVAFLDDDGHKRNLRIHSVPVVGALKDLPKVVVEYGIQEVIIAMPTASGKAVREVVQMCKTARVPSKTIPGMFEILGGGATVTQMRNVDIEDLLRRGVVKTNTEGVGQLLKGARVMVTGAGGSIGSELCRQILGFQPDELILLGHGENSIFTIAAELRGTIRSAKALSSVMRIYTVVADVRDRDRMRQVFQLHRPTVVFHAAAHKHVGLMEDNIPDAVTNNVLGTQVLVDLSDQLGVERFVMISSDKAVNPTCIMGVTKRVAEMVVHDAALRTGKQFVSVRFGNVLGSRGSVVPIFKQQIAQGGPVSITHPDVKRYFMTIPEAVQLVLQAATMGEGGEVFVLDMGEPIRIVDLARDLIRLSGLEEGKDIDIVYTGLLRGEKMEEDLFFESEHPVPSEHEKILVCRNGFHLGKGIDENDESGAVANQVWRESSLKHDVERLTAAAQSGATKNVRALLKLLVPEYQENIAIPEVNILPLKREKKTSMTLVEDGGRQ